MNTQNNKLIAEFMGLSTITFDESMYVLQWKNNLIQQKDDSIFKFDSDWSWLMEVIEKIDKTDTLSSTEEPYWYCVSLMGSYASVTDGKTGKIIIEISEEDDYTWIGIAYKLAVDFVKWYNENKNHDNGN